MTGAPDSADCLAPELAALVNELRRTQATDHLAALPPGRSALAAEAGSIDEAALRLPAGWYDRAVIDRPRDRRPLYGGIAAALLAVPVAVWLVWPGADTPSASRAKPSRFHAATPVTSPDASPAAGFLPLADVVEAADASNKPTVDDARRLLAIGDVQGARSTLATAAAAKSPLALFTMAETFDPNVLAALGASGVSADAVRAKALYGAAAGLGLADAEARLARLK